MPAETQEYHSQFDKSFTQPFRPRSGVFPFTHSNPLKLSLQLSRRGANQFSYLEKKDSIAPNLNTVLNCEIQRNDLGPVFLYRKPLNLRNCHCNTEKLARINLPILRLVHELCCLLPLREQRRSCCAVKWLIFKSKKPKYLREGRVTRWCCVAVMTAVLKLPSGEHRSGSRVKVLLRCTICSQCVLSSFIFYLSRWKTIISDLI